jgi:hypothetical protein
MNKNIISIFIIVLTLAKPIEGYGQTKILLIKHGISFGMCEGYCYNEATYSKSKIIKFSKAWIKGKETEQPDKNDTTKITDTIWSELTKSINLKKFYKLPVVIGCPDCTDGGQEWLEIVTNKKTYKVEIEYGAEINELKKIFNILRNGSRQKPN